MLRAPLQPPAYRLLHWAADGKIRFSRPWDHRSLIVSVRFADRCEGLHDLVDAWFEPGDRQRFLKKRKWVRVLAHRLIRIDAPPLCIHRDLCAVRAAMEAGRNKARRTTY